MRTVSFLLITLFLFTPFASGFNVILRSGKHIEGTWIGEDENTIQVKDVTGVVLSFKKSALDLESMATANFRDPGVASLQPSESAPDPPAKSIVELAEETRRARTGNCRAFTQQDVLRAPEISIFGSESSSQTVLETKLESDVAPSKEEQYWRRTSVSLKRAVAGLREKRMSAETACSRAQERLAAKKLNPHRGTIDLLSVMESPAECDRFNEIDRQLQEAQARLEEFQERARRAEISWQWLN